LCKNVLAAALTPRDFGRVAVLGHFSGFVGSFRLEVFLMRIPAVLYGSATADGRMSATTMPSSPPAAVGTPITGFAVCCARAASGHAAAAPPSEAKNFRRPMSHGNPHPTAVVHRLVHAHAAPGLMMHADAR
jgi:hypothetical protein